MIRNLDDLIGYTRKLGDKLPALRDSIVLERPGCTLEVANEIGEALPGIPESYLDVAKAIRLVGIAIGYFQLAPNSYNGTDLLEKLVDCNSTTAMRSRFDDDGVFQVASWEADPIAVVHRSGRHAVGEVLKYNAGNPEQDAAALANSFEQFLLLAGNLDAVRDKYADVDDPSEGIPEFEACLGEIASGRDVSAWKIIAEVVLS